jgi:hypothetical protein
MHHVYVHACILCSEMTINVSKISRQGHVSVSHVGIAAFLVFVLNKKTGSFSSHAQFLFVIDKILA